MVGASAVPAGGAIHSVLGRRGHQPPGTMTGTRGARWTGTGWGGVIAAQTARGQRPPVGASLSTRRSGHVPGSHWPVPRLWDDNSLRQEPWWNADRRAAPKGQSRARWCGGYGSAFVGVPLPWIYLAKKGEANGKTETPPLCFGSQARDSRFRLRALRYGGRVTWLKFGKLGCGCAARTGALAHLSPPRGERSSERSERG